MSLSVALVHYPIKNKQGEIVTTSVTNLDIHDIARSCKTFGVKKFYIVTPLLPQQQLVERIINHWKQEQSFLYNPDRSHAFELIEVISSLNDLPKNVLLKTLATGANLQENHPKIKTTAEIRKNLEKLETLDTQEEFLLIFGTGFGLAEEVLESSTYFLPPLQCLSTEYNHLSVRSAVAIYLMLLKGNISNHLL